MLRPRITTRLGHLCPPPACAVAGPSSSGPRAYYSSASSRSPASGDPPPPSSPAVIRRRKEDPRKLVGTDRTKNLPVASGSTPSDSLFTKIKKQVWPSEAVRLERDAIGEIPNYNHISSLVDHDVNPEVLTYRRVAARDLARREEPPKKVAMLVRDYVDDHLYNPQYGYFSSPSLEIFSTDQAHGYNFSEFRSSLHFTKELARRYDEYKLLEDAEVRARNVAVAKMRDLEEPFPEVQREQAESKQLWHTPTELFKPWYGRAIARCLVEDYRMKSFPYHDLVIYEMGAGNGTLMSNILDYIEEAHPDVYERTKYRIIEITEQLAVKQTALAEEAGHSDRVEIVNKSIFEWNEVVEEPCFVLAMEVLDNFAHDVVRYDWVTGVPVQGIVTTDRNGDFELLYEPVHDPLIHQFLSLRSLLPPPLSHSPAFPSYLERNPILRIARSSLPFAPNLTEPEFIPTKAMMMMEVLRDYFPRHRLLMSDFSSLPDAIPGFNAPVVQTRHRGEMIAVTTFMVKHGHFDIFFPTDFELFRALYTLIVSNGPIPPAPPSLRYSSLSDPTSLSFRSSNKRAISPTFFTPAPAPWPPLEVLPAPTLAQAIDRSGVSIYGHGEFLRKWAGEDRGRTSVKDGSDIMTGWYTNAKFLF